jgi:uncharacterized protein (TIGR00369 family)
VRESFTRQDVMQTIGAKLESVDPGEVSISLPYSRDLTQQHGFMHAEIMATIVDSSCGYAALSVSAPGTAVPTVEFKLNLLSPAAGESFLAQGSVIKSGRTICFTEGKIWGISAGNRLLVATLSATIMLIPDRADLEN